MRTKRELLASQIALKRRLTNEERLYRELSVFFKKLKKEVLASLEEYWSEYQMLQGHINLICSPVHEAHKEYYEILRKYKIKEYELGKREATRLCNRAGVRYAFKETMSMPISGFIKKDSDKLFGTLPKAEQDLLNRTYKTSEKTLSKVDSQLNNIITEGYRSGKGINDISNQVTKRFDQLASWEAKRIARTEVNTSHNKATVDTYNELGVEYTQWIAASDDRTRDSHVEVDGEIIPMGGKYSNGLSYPGDMSGPIEEWINCRCSNAPFVMPYGYMAPSFSPFREEDLVPIETHNPLEVTEPQPVEPTTYNINSNPNSKTEIQITQAQFDNVIAHQAKRANNKLEFGNVIENETGRLVHSKDIKGKKNTVKIPTHNKPYSVLHNHTNNGGFSGTDVSSHLENRHQEVCYATTPQGVWIMRDTPQTTHAKQSYGVHSNTSSQIMYAFNGHYRTISKEIYDTKYKERFAGIKDRKEYNKLKEKYANECFETHKKWILENYGHGKNENIEIEFIPKERLKHVKF